MGTVGRPATAKDMHMSIALLIARCQTSLHGSNICHVNCEAPANILTLHIRQRPVAACWL